MPNYNFRHIPLDSRALEFIKFRLDVPYELSKVLSARLPLEKGRVIAIAPENISQTALYGFKYGGILQCDPTQRFDLPGGGYAQLTPNTNEYLVGLIHRYLAQNPANCCVFEEANMKAGVHMDKHLPKYSYKFLMRGDKPYHYVDSSLGTPENILTAIKCSNAMWHHTGILSKNVARYEEKCPEVSSETISSLVDQTAHLIIGAYDGESFVIWSSPEVAELK